MSKLQTLLAVLVLSVCSSAHAQEAVPYDPMTENLKFPAHILMASTYHSDEIWPDAVKENWIGLFKNKDGYYTRKTTLTAVRVHDDIVDSKNTEKTGWEVKTENKDESIVLISGLKLPERPVAALARDARILPGEKLVFDYNDATYSIYTETEQKKDKDGNDTVTYRIYLQENTKKGILTQQLADIPNADEPSNTVLFAGDLDGDKKPDFLINTTGHYNVFEPSLFLSGQAAKGELVKLVGRHSSVGC